MVEATTAELAEARSAPGCAARSPPPAACRGAAAAIAGVSPSPRSGMTTRTPPRRSHGDTVGPRSRCRVTGSITRAEPSAHGRADSPPNAGRSSTCWTGGPSGQPFRLDLGARACRPNRSGHRPRRGGSADEPSYLPCLTGAGYSLLIREPDWEEHRRLLKGPDTDINLHVFSRGAGNPGDISSSAPGCWRPGRPGRLRRAQAGAGAARVPLHQPLQRGQARPHHRPVRQDLRRGARRASGDSRRRTGLSRTPSPVRSARPGDVRTATRAPSGRRARVRRGRPPRGSRCPPARRPRCR